MLLYKIRSLYKMDRRQKFANYLLTKDFDFVCLAETWLTDEVSEGEIFLPQYQCFYSNRKTSRLTTSHGGTMICVKKTLDSQELYFDFDVNGSVTICSVCFGMKKILIICCFLPPTNSKYAYDSNSLQNLFKNIATFKKRSDDILIYGDFNFVSINWNSLSSDDELETEFLQYLDVNNRHQKVNFNTGASGILDLFLVNKGIQIIDIHKCEDQLLQRFSNHSPIEVTFNIESFSLVTRQNIVKGYSFCNGDYIPTYMIQKKFDSYCWSNPNKVIELWYQWLNSAIEKFIPKRTLHRSSLPPWITKETSHLLNCLKTTRKKYGNTHPKVRYLVEEIEINADLNKIAYEINLAHDRTTQKLFKYFQGFRKKNFPNTMKYNGEQAETNKSKANLFAKFFASVYIESSHFIPVEEVNTCRILEQIQFDEKEVLILCKDAKTNKSRGPDDIPPLLFKKTCLSITHSLSQIFRKIIQTGIFPAVWKTATVVPLFKKGDRSQVSNYRPVSFLATAGKFFEAIIFKRLYDHCSPLFSKSQFGFRKNRSTVLQLLTFLQKVYKGIETNNDIDVIFTDFSKAFDKVDHGILLQKLYRIGIRGQIFNVLQSFITGRTQKVRVMNELSNEFKVSSGVPQGSLLSPLLFLIFINDLPDICNQMIPLLFADDAKFLSIGLKSENIQHDLNKLYEWTSLNKLPLNVEKCAYLAITNKQYQFYLGKEVIASADYQNDLGLTLSGDLKLNLHIDKVCAKAMKLFHMIKRNVSGLPSAAKLNLYKSMIVPILIYGSP